MDIDLDAFADPHQESLFWNGVRQSLHEWVAAQFAGDNQSIVSQTRIIDNLSRRDMVYLIALLERIWLGKIVWKSYGYAYTLVTNVRLWKPKEYALAIAFSEEQFPTAPPSINTSDLYLRPLNAEDLQAAREIIAEIAIEAARNDGVPNYEEIQREIIANLPDTEVEFLYQLTNDEYLFQNSFYLLPNGIVVIIRHRP